MINWAASLPTFVITLREGVEAALVVGIVLSLLAQTKRQDLIPWVWAAVVSGILASTIVGGLFQGLFRWVQVSSGHMAEILEPLLKVGFTLSAIALLSWMLLWMTAQAKSMKANLSGEVAQRLTDTHHSGWAIFGLVSIAVLREGFETAIFLTTQDQSTGLIGAIAGLISAFIIGWMLFALGVKLNLKLFFQVMGGFLSLIVAGLVMSVCKSLDGVALTLEAFPNVKMHLCLFTPSETQSCLWGPLVWNTSALMPEKQLPGLALKALFGYRDHIYLMQGCLYLAFLSILVRQYLKRLTLNLKPSPNRPIST